MPDGSEQQVTRPAEPDNFAVELGHRLRAARAVTGLSLAQVQRQSGGRWTGGAVGTYERGSRNITAENLAALAGFYGIHPAALIPGALQSRGEGRPALGERDSGAGPSPAMTAGSPAGEGTACSPGGPRGGSQPTPWEPPRQPGHATARARLTAAQRATLRQVRAALQLGDPGLVAGGRTLADSLRSTLPGLADEEIAAVLATAYTWLASPTESCQHLRNAVGLVAAVTLDLARLEVT